MKYIVDHDYHIHTNISIDVDTDRGYGNDEVVRCAAENGFKKVCIANHFWDESVPCDFDWYRKQGYAHIEKALPLPCTDSVETVFSCEADMDKNFNLGITKKTAEKFDFIIVSTTHLHMAGFTTDAAGDDIKTRSELYIKRLEKLLSSDLPFHKIGIAHLTSQLICSTVENGHIKALSLIGDDKFKDIFSAVKRLGMGVEINPKAFRHEGGDIEQILRPYRIASECGCRFYLGSDCHFTENLASAKDDFEKVVSLLGLEEEQKFSF